MQDCIHVTGIRVYGYVGVFPEEQALGQWYEVDLTLWHDLTQAGKSDRLEDALDYRSAIKSVQDLVKTARFALIERLASAIADHLLATEAIDHVRVLLTKVSPPIPDFSGRVSVEITRSRP